MEPESSPVLATRRFVIWLMFCTMLVCLPVLGDESELTTDQQMKQAQAAYDRGAFEEAVVQWRNAAASYSRQRNTVGCMRALLNLSTTYQELGQHRLALHTLERATRFAEDSPASLPALKNQFGVACGCLNHFERAEKTLRDALAIAHAQDDSRAAALVWNNLGILSAAQNKNKEALNAFGESVKLAESATNQLLVAKASANAAAVADRIGLSAESERFNQIALENLKAQSSTHNLAVLYLRCGLTDWQLHHRSRAERAYQNALAIAEKLGDKRALTYALGYLGQIREAEGEARAALKLTRRAAFVAQEIQMADALYRWEWQIGRLQRTLKNPDAAIAAYRRSIETLQPIRRDLLLASGQIGRTFNETVGPVFSQLTDLLLQKADDSSGHVDTQNILREACDNVEQLYSLELEDYLQDECVNLLREKATRLEAVDPNTAVVYIIPLANRTELVIGIGGELSRVKVPVGAEELSRVVHTFRSHLEKRTTNEYLAEAHQLYEWLIAPIRSLLEAHSIQTLVFLPNSTLQGIPMAALYDGEHYLIERFATAVSPSLTLFTPHRIHWKNVQALKAGLAEPILGRPELRYVVEELDSVQKLFGGPKLLDNQFVWPKLKQDFAESQYQLVHLATHGQIGRIAGESYLLAYDGKLSLDQLEELLRPSQFRGRPVELLTLSACQTAVGDDRATLGLAGVAVKAGARSALATLWFVHDESTALLMEEFYSKLKNDPTATKARALQLAQLKLLHNPRFEHPGYWAPYILVGNWL